MQPRIQNPEIQAVSEQVEERPISEAASQLPAGAQQQNWQQDRQRDWQQDYRQRVQQDARCTIERTTEMIGGKWTTLIVRELLGGTKRFGELRARLPGISPKTLTERLRDLEAHGALTRTIYPEVPPRVEYTLTDKGLALRPIFDAMSVWGAAWT